VRRPGQSAQLVQQAVESITLPGVLVPVFQQFFSVKQDVHALGQKLGNALRITLGDPAACRCIEQGFKTGGDQLLGAFDQGASPLNIGQRVDIQLLKTTMQQTVGLQQQIDFIRPQGNMVGLVLTHQMIQWRGQLSHAHHARHMRAAF